MLQDVKGRDRRINVGAGLAPALLSWATARVAPTRKIAYTTISFAKKQ
jgi:hypothetical protein